jgi:hypothetical protein
MDHYAFFDTGNAITVFPARREPGVLGCSSERIFPFRATGTLRRNAMTTLKLKAALASVFSTVLGFGLVLAAMPPFAVNTIAGV